jgi:dephospho-CoA kinase
MTTVLVTGPIGGGKSTVCKRLAAKGLPVYDCDSRCKALYDTVPGLKGRIEQELGIPFTELRRIFEDDSLREKLEALVYPLLVEDLKDWKSQQGAPFAFVESAIALDKPAFDGLYDKVLLVTAPESKRQERNPEAARRGRLQRFDQSQADWIIRNDGTKEELIEQTDNYLQSIKQDSEMKTDLAKILSVSGQHGLYLYVAQARNGAIAESLSDKKRTAFDSHSRISTLSDIAIYTSEGEMRLADVFTAMKKAADEGAAVPGSKASSDEIKTFFIKAVPNYDEDRFYVSHMKKVLEWYDELSKYASLDFVTDEEREAQVEEA